MNTGKAAKSGLTEVPWPNAEPANAMSSAALTAIRPAPNARNPYLPIPGRLVAVHPPC